MPTRRRALARAGSPARALVEPGHTVFGTPLGHSPAGRSRERRSPRARSRTSSRMGQRDLSMNAAAGRVAIELGLPPELSISDLAAAAAVEPRVPPRVAYYQGSYFMASRAQLWRHPRSTYARAHALFAGGDGRCHAGELDWARLSTIRVHEEPVAHDARRARAALATATMAATDDFGLVHTTVVHLVHNVPSAPTSNGGEIHHTARARARL